jgi:hypothetical protein
MNESENTSTSPPRSTGSDYLSDIIKSIGTGNIDPSTPDSTRPSTPQNDLFSSLLSSPELLAKLPTIISTVKPLLEMLSSSSTQSASAHPAAPKVAQSGESTLAARDMNHGGNAHRSALLCALKPYLSSDRRQAIDYILKLDRLGDVLKTL